MENMRGLQKRRSEGIPKPAKKNGTAITLAGSAYKDFPREPHSGGGSHHRTDY